MALAESRCRDAAAEILDPDHVGSAAKAADPMDVLTGTGWKSALAADSGLPSPRHDSCSGPLHESWARTTESDWADMN